ncbi:MAG TPA: DNA repair protein RecO [Candidatus Polarisedimenticolia bacterium]|nr:DNA repair protein RecO [Candidatus Polarisedimenticolia bacterium]
MPLRESEAFVLRSQPLGESDRVVTFLTRKVGKLRGVAKGARRSHRRFGSNLEPLSRVRLSYFEREGADLTRIESAELLESFYRLQEDPVRGAVLACCAEVADAFAREQQEDDAFFRLLHAVLLAVRNGLDLHWAQRYFEIWTLRLHGVLPSLESCPACGKRLSAQGARYNRDGSGMACGRCAGAPRPGDITLPATTLSAAAEILAGPPGALIGAPRAPGHLAPLAALAEAIFVDQTDRRFKSYEVLRALRSGA